MSYTINKGSIQLQSQELNWLYLISVWFGSGFIYARLNLNQYIDEAGQKKKFAWVQSWV